MEQESRSKENNFYAKTSDVIQIALRKSWGAVIVNVRSLDQEKIAGYLSPSFAKVSTSSILGRRTPDIPREAKGMVITGYSRDLDREEEKRVQNFVRATVANKSPSGRAKGFPVVVLSETLPHEQVFHDASLPWWNGPFQGDESVYSLEGEGNKVRLTRHTSEEIKGEKRKSLRYECRWGIKEIIKY